MKHGKLFRGVRSIVVLAAAVFGAVFLVAIRSEPERRTIDDSVPVVQVAEARAETRTMVIDAFGTVKPRDTLKLTAEVPGRVVFIHEGFKEGGAIDQDEVIVRIDQRTFLLDVRSARVRIRQADADIRRLSQEIDNLKSDIRLATANVKLTTKELTRIRALNKEDFASITRLDQAEQQDIQARMTLQGFQNSLSVTDSAMEQKQAALAMAKIDLDRAELALEKTEIRSEFYGWVLKKRVEMGEFITIGQPLGTVYRQGGLDVEVRIPLEKMQWLDPIFDKGDLPRAVVTMTGSNPDQEWRAKVARVKATIDEKTRTLPMVLEVEPETRGPVSLRPGTFVRCTISGSRYDPVFVVPRHLLRPGNTLFVLEDGQLAMRKVEVLRRFKEEIFISRGLGQGDKIVLSPLAQAVDGMKLIEQKNEPQGNNS
ncbi:MAG: efflux RND transporter periplasmic adaptor subunit [Desulfobacteraceae bacterium]|nr:efflux RND transporter periplasmic adaptor subunit [Desulfobacteraceae bacterium]